MSSRLIIFCNQILEMGWLAALITAPLFFNIYSSRVFEPDKITLVRSIALVMAGAWLIRLVERGFSGMSLRAGLKENPLALPTLAVVLVNLISTLFSVAPTVSLWGSYQRLQGLDTTLSYIVIFFIAAGSLRTRAQLDRAINTTLVVSFPIAYYGLIQHYKLDPLPWGGDVTLRVASNMGNSIFVAAFLIMVAPLSLARLIETLGRVTQRVKSRGRRAMLGVVAAAGVIAVAVAWVSDFWFGQNAFWLGLGFAGTFILACVLAASLLKFNRRDALLGAVYIVHLAILLVAIFYTQSRGPWLGLLGGIVAFGILYPLVRGLRWLSLGVIGLTGLGLLFLIILNLPVSPLDPLKKIPYVGRLGNLLETDTGTGKVRELIWQGAVPLILPHAPLWSPTTGDDALNLVRPLIGYGPETMYVAYNPFYPPDLAHLEARNASPDRSHNETFDSLVMTGLLGFGAYIFLFIAIFYFGLKALGMIQSTLQRNVFLALWFGAGFLAALAFGMAGRWNFFGVALPAGMVVGFFLFLLCDALGLFATENSKPAPRTSHALWLAALIAAFIAHFIEINFGIAIVSTRTYFWFYAALLVILGMNRIGESESETQSAPAADPAASGERKLTRRERRALLTAKPASVKPVARDSSLAATLTWTLMFALVFVTLVYEFVTVQGGGPNPLDSMCGNLFDPRSQQPSPIYILCRSMFVKDGLTSFAIFSLMLVTFIFAGILGYDDQLGGESRWLAVAIFAVLAFTVTMWFALFQTRWLSEIADQRSNPVDKFTNILGLYYLFLMLLIVAASVASGSARAPGLWTRTSASLALAPITVLVVVIAIYMTNFTAIIGDILYKVGSNLDGGGAWNQSIQVYDAALRLQPDQDFYLLFLGRSYLEAARAAPDAKQRVDGLQASEQRLLRARSLNPLNTDHSANLARLNRIWATMSENPADKAARLKLSTNYYRDATRLSPNTAHLYNEWSQVYTLGGDNVQARTLLEKSLALDREFPQTYQILGDLLATQREEARAVDTYVQAIALDPGSLTGPDGLPVPNPLALFVKPQFAPLAIEAYRASALKRNGSLAALLAIAEIYNRTGQPERAQQELTQAVQQYPQDLNANIALVNFLSTRGQIDAAVQAMQQLQTLIPPNSADSARMRDFGAQLESLQRAIQAARQNPNDIAAHRALAAMWRARGQLAFALTEYQTVVRLAPSDYDAAKSIALLNLALNNLDDAQHALTTATASAPDKEKAVWQNLQAALNDQKSQRLDQATKNAQAALALASEQDQPLIQAYLAQIQGANK